MVHDRHMSETKVTPFRFTDEELEVLGLIEGHTGIRSRTEALRGVLREHTRAAHPPAAEDPPAPPPAADPDEKPRT
jgi:hypothetical protein